jgi:hypothetical protein
VTIPLALRDFSLLVTDLEVSFFPTDLLTSLFYFFYSSLEECEISRNSEEVFITLGVYLEGVSSSSVYFIA